MRVFGIDPGYAIVGYGAVRAAAGRYETIEYGAVTTRAGDDFGLRLKEIYEGMTELITALRPQAAAVEKLRGIYRDMPECAQELEWSVRPDNPWEGKGSGYVVDTLRGAFMLLERAGSYEEAVRGAVALGDDTDTTACVAGGLAGVRFGAGSIPRRWMETLRGRACVEELIARVWS